MRLCIIALLLLSIGCATTQRPFAKKPLPQPPTPKTEVFVESPNPIPSAHQP